MSSTRRFSRSVRSVALVAAGTLALGVLPATTANAEPNDILAACENAPDSNLDSAGNARLDAVEACLNNWDGPDGNPVLQGTNGSALFDQAISRAQFAAVLVRIAAILGVPLPEVPADPTFPDVPTTHFFYDVIEQGAGLGLFVGKTVDGETVFDPTGDVSYAQAIVTIYRLITEALGQTLTDDGGASSGLDCGFASDELAALEGAGFFGDATTLPDACGGAADRGSIFDLFATTLNEEVENGTIDTPFEPPTPPGPTVNSQDTMVIDLSNSAVDPVREFTFSNLDPDGDYNLAMFPCWYDGDGYSIHNGGLPFINTDGTTRTGGEWTFLDEDFDSDADEQGTTWMGDADIQDVFFEDIDAQESFSGADNWSPNAQGDLLVRVGVSDKNTEYDCGILVLWSDNADAAGATADVLDLDRDAVDTYAPSVDNDVVVAGPTVWHQGEAPNGYDQEGVVLYVDTTGNFLIDDGDGYLLNWGREDDLYYYDGAEVDAFMSQTRFESYISFGDDLDSDDNETAQDIKYSRTGPTLFAIEDDFTSSLATFTVAEGDAPTNANGVTDADTDKDDLIFTISGQPAPSLGNIDEWCFEIFNATTLASVLDSCMAEDETNTLGNTPFDKFHYLNHGLADGKYVARLDADSETDDGVSLSMLSAEFQLGIPAETVVPTITDIRVTTDNGVVGVLDSTDVIRIDFSENMKDPTGSAAWFFRLSDGDSVYQFDCSTSTCVDSDSNAAVDATVTDGNAANDTDRFTITLSTATLISGTNNGLDHAGSPGVTLTLVSNAWDDIAGNQLDLAGSADVKVDVE